MEKLFGKYRAEVVNNIDPLNQGRLMIQVSNVSELPPSWAVACVPMGTTTVPPIGANVWVEFERGDPDYPVWVGCRWGT